MAKTNGPSQGASPAKAGVRSLDGHPVQNTILRNLPPKEREVVFSKMKYLEFPTHRVLNEMAEPIENGYFINSGLASILNVMSDGKSVEVGLTGQEGFVGLPLLVGFSTSPTLAVTQIAGSAFRVSAKDLKNILRGCPELARLLHRYSLEFALQVTQVAACNRLHNITERLGRWLLTCHDRVVSDRMPLTQEFLAAMLGTPRTTVTLAAGSLHQAGIIDYTRGQVTIKDRQGLEDAACECYRTVRAEFERLGLL